MKLIIAGSGQRISVVAGSFGAVRKIIISKNCDIQPTRKIKIVAADPAMDDCVLKLDPTDVIVVCSDDDAEIAAIVGNMKRLFPLSRIVALVNKATSLNGAHEDVLCEPVSTVYASAISFLFRYSKTLTKLSKIRKLARARKKVAILLWGSPDPDSLSSALALSHLLKDDNQNISICSLKDVVRPENIEMISLLKIDLVKFDRSLVDADTLLCTVDAQPSFFEGLDDLNFDVVIDHHKPSRSFKAAVKDVRRNYGSTASILTEYFVSAKEPLTTRIATALYYGLITDTANFRRNVGQFEFEALRILKRHSDEDIIRRIELAQMPQDTMSVLGTALASKRQFGDVLFSYIGKTDNVEICPYIADWFIRIQGIAWTVVACRSEEKLVVCVRTDGYRNNNAGRLAEKFGEFGTGGGDRTKGRAEIQVEAIKAQIHDASDFEFDKWLLKRVESYFKSIKNPIPEISEQARQP